MQFYPCEYFSITTHVCLRKYCLQFICNSKITRIRMQSDVRESTKNNFCPRAWRHLYYLKFVVIAKWQKYYFKVFILTLMIINRSRVFFLNKNSMDMHVKFMCLVVKLEWNQVVSPKRIYPLDPEYTGSTESVECVRIETLTILLISTTVRLVLGYN